MDPENPRWQTSETRVARAKLLWSVVVGVTAAAALSAAIVVSCLDRGSRAVAEPSYLETTAARPATTAPAVPALPQTTVIVVTPPSPAGAPADSAGRASVTSVEMVSVTPTAAPPTTAPAAVMVGPARVVTTSASAPPRVAPGASAREATAPQAPAILDPVLPNGVATGSAPDPTMGAGRFNTDAPPWAGSAYGLSDGGAFGR